MIRFGGLLWPTAGLPHRLSATFLGRARALTLSLADSSISPMSLIRLFVLSSLIALSSRASTAADLAELFMPPEIYNPKMSPDGAYLGFMARQGDRFAVGIYNI